MSLEKSPFLAVIGAGPAGLMAAETAASAGVRVSVYDAMPSFGRKFLLAGKGGLNLTHSEPLDRFSCQYENRQPDFEHLLKNFGPADVREWARGLGIETFAGSSGRIFPLDMKAAPLLRAWLRKLRSLNVTFYPRHKWVGWCEQGFPRFMSPKGECTIQPAAVILALGGGSWKILGSDGAWVDLLRTRGLDVVELKPSNCGFNVDWSEHFKARFAGNPLKPVAITFQDTQSRIHSQKGELIITESGVEGSLIYKFSAQFRKLIEENGKADIELDLAPDKSEVILAQALAKPRKSRTASNHLHKVAGFNGLQSGLLREVLDTIDFSNPARLAELIKHFPLGLVSTRPLDEAISSAGGVPFELLDENLMLRQCPGWFCAGEMLDFEAPTGGYLLTASFATGFAAGLGAVKWLAGFSIARNEMKI